MKIEPQEIHIWQTELSLTPEQAEEKLTLLSQDEYERAVRYRFNTHRHRYIASRSFLRQILGLYLDVDQKSIDFLYSEYKKPYVLPNHHSIQFNLSHSDNLAILACTQNHAIGVDVEKEQYEYKEDVAKRFLVLWKTLN